MIGRLIGCAVALGLALAGCGSTQSTTTTTPRGAGQGPTVRFTGGSIPGTVYVGVGPDELSLDAYRLSGPLSESERLSPRAVIRSASGQVRSFLTGDWHPTCWLRNDTIFAVNLLKSTLGTLNPGTGAITTIGRFPSSASLFVLDCSH